MRVRMTAPRILRAGARARLARGHARGPRLRVPPPRRSPHRGSRFRRKVEVHRDTMVSASVSRAMENYRTFSSCRIPIRSCAPRPCAASGTSTSTPARCSGWNRKSPRWTLQGAEAIKLYTTLLKAFPDYARNDQVLYQLSRAYETTGQSGQALGTLDRIVQRYPQSPQLDECSSGAASCCSPTSATRMPSAPTPPSSARRWLGVLPAEPVQARLVAVQAVAGAREPAVLRRSARSGAWQRRRQVRAPGEAQARRSRAGRGQPCGS